jgi:hypothetical protein
LSLELPLPFRVVSSLSIEGLPISQISALRLHECGLYMATLINHYIGAHAFLDLQRSVETPRSSCSSSQCTIGPIDLGPAGVLPMHPSLRHLRSDLIGQ